ncbi:MAG: adenosylcobinamide-phosphate synthase CbiB [Desulfobacteraceae bacterium]|nr:adenosylcobinamide-phosphate synthase CbiB [Desulfobacteraceae bacterium]
MSVAFLPGFLLPVAFVLDLLLGDPRWLPHPIRWMGAAITWAESRFRRLPLSLGAAGGLFAASLIAGTALAAFGLLRVAAAVHPLVAVGLEVLLVFYCLSARSLMDAAMAVYRPLREGDASAAKGQVAMIIGRDTAPLSEAGVARACVETVAENLVDGVVSPLFYAALGGAPLALAFKMVNTLDSMVGYKNERYRSFGRAAARIDDAANYLPARLAMPLIALAAALLAGRGRRTLGRALREGRRHISPNAGIAEAAFAGALGVCLGGPNYYGGVLVDKPFIGSGLGPVVPDHIPRACELMLVTALISLGAFWVAALGLGLI